MAAPITPHDRGEPIDELEALRRERDQLAADLNATHRLLEETRAQLSELSVTDQLTGLANRRSFVEALDNEVTRCRRYGHELTLIMIDIDDFEVFNDTYGHAAGDRALAGLARLLVHDIREVDLAARYGEDEFGLLLPSTGYHGAVQLAARIRFRVGERDVLERPISICQGVAALGDGVESPQQLIEASLEALQDAKNRGPGNLA